MPIPSGSHYTDSSRRTVRLADGSMVSRSQAENMFARDRGYRSSYERRQTHRIAGGARRVRDVTKGAPDPDQAARDYRELQRDYARNDNDYRNIDKSPDGPLARYLRSIGRKTDTTYFVGESPAA